jgi:hypothetical protein
MTGRVNLNSAAEMSNIWGPPLYYDVRQGYVELFGRYDWDFHVVLTFDNIISISKAIKKVKKDYLKKLKMRHSDIMFGALFIVTISQDRIPHVHMLLVSDHSFIRSLQSIKKRELKDLWPMISKVTTNKEWNKEQIAWYFTKSKNMPLHDGDKWGIGYYRKNLLNRLRIN